MIEGVIKQQEWFYGANKNGFTVLIKLFIVCNLLVI